MESFLNFLKKIRWGIVGAILLLFSTSLVFFSTFNANQLKNEVGQKVSFDGEYSFDGQNYEIILDQSEYPIENETLYLKGKFVINENDELKHLKYGEEIYLYLNHIAIEIYINGKISFSSGIENGSFVKDLCGKRWVRYDYNVNENDDFEIRLYNPHAYGNNKAYDEFLTTSVLYQPDTTAHLISKTQDFIRVIGMGMLVVSLIILGFFFFSLILKVNQSRTIGVLGMMVLFSSLYVIFDTIDVSFWSENVAFNSNVSNLCLMLAVFFVMFFIYTFASSKSKKFAKVAISFSLIFDVCIFLHSVLFRNLLCDYHLIWFYIHIFLASILLGCSISENIDAVIDKKIGRFLVCFSALLSMLAFIADFICVGMNVYQGLLVSKIIFSSIFLIAIIFSLKIIPEKFRDSLRAKELKSELQNYRVAIMLSQIQPHFLYNALTSIYYLCDKEPKLAKQAIGWFSTYLRGNLDSIKKDKAVSFGNELKHIEIYLKLEKMRFEDKLNIVYDLKTVDFEVPSLAIQPLIENAVNHGVGNKEEGGTVILRTVEEEKCYKVIIEDDGIGFDQNIKKDDGRSHIGLSNVKERIKTISNGDLIINSQLGKGTTITVIIPKENK